MVLRTGGGGRERGPRPVRPGNRGNARIRGINPGRRRNRLGGSRGGGRLFPSGFSFFFPSSLPMTAYRLASNSISGVPRIRIFPAGSSRYTRRGEPHPVILKRRRFFIHQGGHIHFQVQQGLFYVLSLSGSHRHHRQTGKFFSERRGLLQKLNGTHILRIPKNHQHGLIPGGERHFSGRRGRGKADFMPGLPNIEIAYFIQFPPSQYFEPE